MDDPQPTQPLAWPLVTDQDPDLHRFGGPTPQRLLDRIGRLTANEVVVLEKAFLDTWGEGVSRAGLIAAWAEPVTAWNRWINSYWPIGEGFAHEPAERFRDGLSAGLERVAGLGLPTPSAESIAELHVAFRYLTSEPIARRGPLLGLEILSTNLGAVMACASAAITLESDSEMTGAAPLRTAIGDTGLVERHPDQDSPAPADSPG